MIVKLTKLDELTTSLYYYPLSDVWLNDKEVIGTCRLFTENGKHFGELDLDVDVDPEYHFYYQVRLEPDGGVNFLGLNFTKDEENFKPTTQLKDMIVSN